MNGLVAKWHERSEYVIPLSESRSLNVVCLVGSDRPGSQVVRHSSAKGIYGGSIPPQASRQKCPSGGIGIRARLKIVSRKGCGFDSHLGHQDKI